MDQWYYAKDGQQCGPITLEHLRDLARSGQVTAATQVWHESMKDWTAAGQVAGIFEIGAPAGAVPDPFNPYATPLSDWVAAPISAPSPGEAIAEIVPGSDPLDPVACVKRGFDIAIRNIGAVALTMLLYYGITYGLSFFLEFVKIAAFGVARSGSSFGGHGAGTSDFSGPVLAVAMVFALINQVVSVYLNLGLCRIWLNLVSGKQVTVGMLFGQGGKLLRGFLASLLLIIAVGLGLLLFIVPGVYIALRYGQFLMAIVDKDMGIMDSFSYSSSITTNNRMPLFLLWLLSILIVIAGFIALCVGVFAAIPLVWLAAAVAYRWMQYGRLAAMDHPGTQVPLLANQ